MTSYVLIHDSGHGPWAWYGVKEVLQAQMDRLPVEQVVLPLLPGHGQPPSEEPGRVTVERYVRAVADEILDRDLRDVVLVGHSTTSIVIPYLVSQMPERFKRLVFLAGVIPGEGRSVLETCARCDNPRVTEADSYFLPEGWVREALCNDMEERMAAFLLKSLTPVPLRPLREGVALNSFHKAAPTTYVVLEKDRAVPPALQREMLLALEDAEVVAINAGHNAMMTRPRHVASVLLHYV